MAHVALLLARLEADVFPVVGSRPVAEIDAPELLDVLRRVEKRGVIETARRLRQICGQVFRYAIASSRAKHDPSADLRGALKSPGRARGHKAMPSGTLVRIRKHGWQRAAVAHSRRAHEDEEGTH